MPDPSLTESPMKRLLAAAVACAAFSASSAFAAPPQDSPAGEQRFRELYKELVETNTALSAGGRKLAAGRLAAAPKGGRLPRQRPASLRGARSPEGRRIGRGLSGTRSETQGDSIARAHRRCGSKARGLDPGSLQAGRRKRLFLRPRRRGRQGRGGHLGRHVDPLQE